MSLILPIALHGCDVTARLQVTIDDCTHVIDAGRVREMRYDPITRMSCLVEVWISKASSPAKPIRSAVLVPVRGEDERGPIRSRSERPVYFRVSL